MMRALLHFAVAIALGSAGCTDCGDPVPAADAVWPDASADASPDANLTMPISLRDTLLYSDFDNEVLAEGVEAFEPRYEAWADGATKRRWVYLPPGTQIDTSDMDYWGFPEGTKFWQEFTRDGTRVETRFLFKNGPTTEDWFMMAYLWNAEQNEALAVEDGMMDALGTNHDVPNTSACENCHSKMPDQALGFSAIQLSHSNGGLTLSDLRTNGQLTNDPPVEGYTIPGDAVIEPALGYMHSNCAGCHHPRTPILVVIPLVLRINVADTVADQTGPYQTGVCVPPTIAAGGQTSIVEGGDPLLSMVHYRMDRRTPQQMPPLATEDVDTVGLGVVDAWINSLSACP